MSTKAEQQDYKDLQLMGIVFLAVCLSAVCFWAGKKNERKEIKTKAANYIDKGCSYEQQQAIEICLFGEVQE